LLGAFKGWTNKEWLLEEMLRSGIEPVREALWTLLYGEAALHERFDAVRNGVRMMGSAAISEVLAHHNPHLYPVWNGRTRRGLIALGIVDEKLPRSLQISGRAYENVTLLMEGVLSAVSKVIPKTEDFLTLEFLLLYLSLHHLRSQRALTVRISDHLDTDFNHDDVVDQLLELGDGLGFEVAKEVNILPGCRIDAVWRSRIANLGMIAYAFEVHRRGSRDSAILNLQRAASDPTIQKVIIVARPDDLAVFRREIATLYESFRQAVGYFEVGELTRAIEHLQALKDILNALGLLSINSLFD
jgi:hypothetical protein